jgi:hypothetical protein
MKDVKDMTKDELFAESLRLNRRIYHDKRQAWKERQNAKCKIDNMDDYIKKLKDLYV